MIKYKLLILLILFTGCENNNININKTKNIICPQVYAPVCAKILVECIKAPCPKIQQTFSNSCFLKKNPRAKFLHNGECAKK